MEGINSLTYLVKKFLLDIDYIFAEYMGTHSTIIYLHTIQLITKHFTSYSAVDVAKAKG